MDVLKIGGKRVGNTIENVFDELMDERIHQIAYKKCINDFEYLNANKEAVALMEILRNSLVTDEQRALLNELDTAFRLTEAIFLEFAYRQGLEDSQMIHKGFETFRLREPLYV